MYLEIFSQDIETPFLHADFFSLKKVTTVVLLKLGSWESAGGCVSGDQPTT